MEEIAKDDSGVCVIAKRSGTVRVWLPKEIRVTTDDGTEDVYPL